jgi:hypothetical protein
MGLLKLVPLWLWLVITIVLSTISITSLVALSDTNFKLAKEIVAHSTTKTEHASAENRALLNMADRYITLQTELEGVRSKGSKNAEDIKNARSELDTRSKRMFDASSDLERELAAAEHGNIIRYASGAESFYRACAEEYINLGLGDGGAAEAANAAHAQKRRADALERALPPVPPIPPIK